MLTTFYTIVFHSSNILWVVSNILWLLEKRHFRIILKSGNLRVTLYALYLSNFQGNNFLARLTDSSIGTGNC